MNSLDGFHVRVAGYDVSFPLQISRNFALINIKHKPGHNVHKWKAKFYFLEKIDKHVRYSNQAFDLDNSKICLKKF